MILKSSITTFLVHYWKTNFSQSVNLVAMGETRRIPDFGSLTLVLSPVYFAWKESHEHLCQRSIKSQELTDQPPSLEDFLRVSQFSHGSHCPLKFLKFPRGNYYSMYFLDSQNAVSRQPGSKLTHLCFESGIAWQYKYYGASQSCVM